MNVKLKFNKMYNLFFLIFKFIDNYRYNVIDNLAALIMIMLIIIRIVMNYN